VLSESSALRHSATPSNEELYAAVVSGSGVRPDGSRREGLVCVAPAQPAARVAGHDDHGRLQFGAWDCARRSALGGAGATPRRRSPGSATPGRAGHLFPVCSVVEPLADRLEEFAVMNLQLDPGCYFSELSARTAKAPASHSSAPEKPRRARPPQRSPMPSPTRPAPACASCR